MAIQVLTNTNPFILQHNSFKATFVPSSNLNLEFINYFYKEAPAKICITYTLILNPISDINCVCYIY